MLHFPFLNGSKSTNILVSNQILCCQISWHSYLHVPVCSVLVEFVLKRICVFWFFVLEFMMIIKHQIHGCVWAALVLCLRDVPQPSVDLRLVWGTAGCASAGGLLLCICLHWPTGVSSNELCLSHIAREKETCICAWVCRDVSWSHLWAPDTDAHDVIGISNAVSGQFSAPVTGHLAVDLLSILDFILFFNRLLVVLVNVQILR